MNCDNSENNPGSIIHFDWLVVLMVLVVLVVLVVSDAKKSLVIFNSSTV